MADLKLYNNGEGKILFSAGDRIIKQPYEFKSGFIGVCEIDISLGNTDFTILRNSYRLTTSLPTTEHTRFNSSFLLRYYFVDNVNQRQRIEYKGLLLTNGFRPHPINRVWMHGIIYDNDIKRVNYFIPNTIYTDEYANIPDWDNDSTIIRTSASAASTIISNYCVFSRKLPQSELNFLWNNGLWNDFQSRVGLEVFLLMDKAEILNTGFADFVGIRDHSGHNRHGRIMNLPAGTLQEQLDWANENLFVPFIS